MYIFGSYSKRYYIAKYTLRSEQTSRLTDGIKEELK